MSRVYDYNKKEWVDVSDEEATRYVAKGSHGFEAGIKIPVVTPEGETGYIPSENAHEAFKSGYRFGTQADFVQTAAIESDQLRRQHYDDSGHAALAGALRGMTLGGSDVLMSQFLTEEEAQGLQLYKEENPMASLSGEVAGTLLPALLTGGASASASLGGAASRGLSKYTAGGIGQKIYSGVEAATTARLAGQISPRAAGIISKVTGGAAEGAFFGVGQGVSEAALGEPKTVVETLNTVGEGAFLGGLFGGATGGVFGLTGMAAGAIKGSAQRLGEKAARREIGKEFAAGRIKHTPNVDPETRKILDEISEDFSKNPEVIEAYIKGGRPAAKQAAKELEQLRKDVVKAQKQTWADLQKEARKWPTEQRELMEAAVAKEGGDIHAAMHRLYDSARDDLVNLRTELAELPGEAKIIKKIDTKLNDFRNKMRRFDGDDKLAREADGLVENFDQAILKHNPLELGVDETQGTELLYALGMRRYIDDVIEDGGKVMSLPGVEKNLIALRNDLNDLIIKHPSKEVGKLIKTIDGRYDASKQLSKHIKATFLAKPKGRFSTKYITTSKMDPIQKAAKEAEYGIAPKVGPGLLNAMVEPQNADTLNRLLSRASRFGAEIEGLAKPIKSFQEKEAIRKQIKKKIKEVFGRGEEINIKAATEVLQDLANSKAHQKLDSLIDYEKALLNSDKAVSNVDKYVLLKQALGEDVSEEMLNLQRHSAAYNRLMAIDDMSPSPGGVGKLLQTVAGFRARGALSSVGPRAAAGGLMAGPAGAAVGAGADIAHTMSRNPMRRLETIANVHKRVNQGAEKISKMLEWSSNRVVGGSKKISRPARVTAAWTAGDDSTKKKRERVQRAAETINKLAEEPARLVEMSEQYIAPFDDVPAIQAAMSEHSVAAANYLHSVMPDGLKPSQNIFGRKYPPSDADIADFARHLDAVTNPLSVLEKVGNGTVALAEIRALQAVYPSIYYKLQKQVISDITEKGDKIPYSRRVMLGTVLQIPTDASLQGQFIADMQQKYQVDQGGRPAQPELRGKLDSQPEQSTMTLTDQIENRGVANP